MIIRITCHYMKYLDSILKSMTKDALIELLKIAQHNYECASECLFNLRQYTEKLGRALDRACEELGNSRGCPIEKLKMDNDGEIDCSYENHDCKKCWRDYLMKGENE